eukprot:14102857-Heterocapsa_arctica.AAC.1
MMITHSRHARQLTLKTTHTQDNSKCALWGLTGGWGQNCTIDACAENKNATTANTYVRSKRAPYGVSPEGRAKTAPSMPVLTKR